MNEALQAFYEYVSDKLGNTLDDGGSWFQFILDYLSARIALTNTAANSRRNINPFIIYKYK